MTTRTRFLSPSSINYIHSELLATCDVKAALGPLGHSNQLIGGPGASDASNVSPTSAQPAQPTRVQVVDVDGHWFALDSAQLYLCKKLEADGRCTRVRVEVVSIAHIPPNVRKLMVVPDKVSVSLKTETETITATAEFAEVDDSGIVKSPEVGKRPSTTPSGPYQRLPAESAGHDPDGIGATSSTDTDSVVTSDGDDVSDDDDASSQVEESCSDCGSSDEEKPEESSGNKGGISGEESTPSDDDERECLL